LKYKCVLAESQVWTSVFLGLPRCLFGGTLAAGGLLGLITCLVERVVGKVDRPGVFA